MLAAHSSMAVGLAMFLPAASPNVCRAPWGKGGIIIIIEYSFEPSMETRILSTGLARINKKQIQTKKNIFK